MTARVLVTGGEGLVGSAVVARLLAAGHEVTTLTLPDAEPHDGVTVVRGDARDATAVAEAARAVDAVAHLAAIPHPFAHPPDVVFGNNTQATFTVLWTAAALGVRRFAIAGSVNATGLLMHPEHPPPNRYPVGVHTPGSPADAYSLSKRVDEEILRAVCRRFGAAGVALRLPLIVTPGNVVALREWADTRLAEGRGDGWGWLDARDAAEAFRRALTAPLEGAHVVHVAADDVFADLPTEELLDRHAAAVPRDRVFEGRDAPVDTAAAFELFGFRPSRRLSDVGEPDASEEDA